MYSDADLQSAVEAGVLSADAAEALRQHLAARQGLPSADEEQFRLITGFNDVFVTIACALVIFAAAVSGGNQSGPLGGLLVAVAAWAMAEVFTRRRRMALPSIVLLLAFVIGAGCAVGLQIIDLIPLHAVDVPYQDDGVTRVWTRTYHTPAEQGLAQMGAAVAAALAAFAHWRRFRVAITVAAAVGAGVLLALAAVQAVTAPLPDPAGPVRSFGESPWFAPAALLCGLGCFAYAMRWDMSDPQRRTQRADVAFWLHLLAAPLIAHPLFQWMGVTGNARIGPAVVAGVLAIYLLFAVIALAIDRRALLVSALTYVLGALASLFRTYGSVEIRTALTALVIGSALLMLSAWWSAIRRSLVPRLPAGLPDRLPPTG